MVHAGQTVGLKALALDIIDRRPNPHGKNLENRQRVLQRARSVVARKTREALDQGTIREVGREQAVTIPADTLHEPSFHTVFTSGKRNVVLSGNKEFSVGDRIGKPKGAAGRAAARALGKAAARARMASASC